MFFLVGFGGRPGGFALASAPDYTKSNRFCITAPEAVPRCSFSLVSAAGGGRWASLPSPPLYTKSRFCITGACWAARRRAGACCLRVRRSPWLLCALAAGRAPVALGLLFAARCASDTAPVLPPPNSARSAPAGGVSLPVAGLLRLAVFSPRPPVPPAPRWGAWGERLQNGCSGFP